MVHKNFLNWNKNDGTVLGDALRIARVQKNKKAIKMYKGAPFRLQQYMSRMRFVAILSAIKYTKENPPAFVDHFW